MYFLDWNNLFTTKCSECKLPIKNGSRWVEALGNAFHTNCFNCKVRNKKINHSKIYSSFISSLKSSIFQTCHANLTGTNFFARDSKPFCRMHA